MRDINVESSSGGGSPARVTGLTLGRVALAGVSMEFERNAEIFGAGEPALHLHRIVRGVVRTVRFSADGRRQILAFHMAGDVIGLEMGPTHEYTAEAVTPCELVLVRRSLVEKALGEDIGAAQALLRLASAELQNAHEHALMLGKKGAGERVAAFLLQLANRLTGECELNLPMSRLDIADYLALTIETVSRAFTQMERDRAIALPSSRHVVVRDRGALEALQAA